MYNFCSVCAKNNESVKKIEDKFLCSQCLKAGLYMQEYHLKSGAHDKGYNLFKGNKPYSVLSQQNKSYAGFV